MTLSTSHRIDVNWIKVSTHFYSTIEFLPRTQNSENEIELQIGVICYREQPYPINLISLKCTRVCWYWIQNSRIYRQGHLPLRGSFSSGSVTLKILSTTIIRMEPFIYSIAFICYHKKYHFAIPLSVKNKPTFMLNRKIPNLVENSSNKQAIRQLEKRLISNIDRFSSCWVFSIP